MAVPGGLGSLAWLSAGTAAIGGYSGPVLNSYPYTAFRWGRNGMGPDGAMRWGLSRAAFTLPRGALLRMLDRAEPVDELVDEPIDEPIDAPPETPVNEDA